jgi:hypothetical protein
MKPAAGKLMAIGLLSLLSASAASADAAALKALDTDNDGTVSLAEAQTGASKVFTAVNTDKEGTLRAKELEGRLDAAVLGTLDAKQYAKIVQGKFKAADTDNDGTLDEAELSSPAGAVLLKHIQKQRLRHPNSGTRANAILRAWPKKLSSTISQKFSARTAKQIRDLITIVEKGFAAAKDDIADVKLELIRLQTGCPPCEAS